MDTVSNMTMPVSKQVAGKGNVPTPSRPAGRVAQVLIIFETGAPLDHGIGLSPFDDGQEVGPGRDGVQPQLEEEKDEDE